MPSELMSTPRSAAAQGLHWDSLPLSIVFTKVYVEVEGYLLDGYLVKQNEYF